MHTAGRKHALLTHRAAAAATPCYSPPLQVVILVYLSHRQRESPDLKVVCRLALAIWSYWYGCRERIFLNIAKASNPLETP